MIDPKRRLRRRAKRLEHGLRKQTDRALVPLRRLSRRARRWRQRAATMAVRGLSIAGAFVQAIEILRDEGRRFARRSSPVGARRADRPMERGPSAAQAPVAAPDVPPEAPSSDERAREAPHADERTIRRVAEQQRGGMSTEEMLARYEAGLNPGGLHGRAMRERLPTDEIRHVSDEPDDPKARRPGHERHMPAHRRGS